MAEIDELLCIIEIPKGSRNKYEWDHERRMILFDRFLSSMVVFPTDYGFVAESLGPDGEDPNREDVDDLDDIPEQLVEKIAQG